VKLTNRDGFSAKTRQRIAHRAGYHCSNPTCGRGTAGPSNEAPDATVNVGVAAHICAAARGGRRYDGSMTARQRASIANAIWLCQTCAALIDRDAVTYSVEILKQWKSSHEAAIAGSGAVGAVRDTEVLAHLARMLDRPAFCTPFGQEASMADFRQAITDTIEALNTGVWRTRDRVEIRSAAVATRAIRSEGPGGLIRDRRTPNTIARELRRPPASWSRPCMRTALSRRSGRGGRNGSHASRSPVAVRFCVAGVSAQDETVAIG
jgi:hypothetical protein